MSVTLKDIADKAGVSVTTVSRVINFNDHAICSEDTQKYIWSLAEQLGYKPKSNKKTEVRQAPGPKIGYVLSSEIMSDPFYSHVLKGIETEALRLGATIAFGCLTPDLYNPDVFQSILDESKAEAVIYMNGAGNLYHDLLKNESIHIIMAGMESRNLSRDIPGDLRRTYDYVGIDFYGETLYWLMNKMLNRFDRVGYVGPERSERYAAYRDSHAKAMKTFDPGCSILTMDWKTETGKAEVLKYLQSGKDVPEAIFAGCDTLAIGTMMALKEFGLKVPQDVKVMGFDNIEMADYLTPSLTTVEMPITHIGQVAVRAAIERIRGERNYPIHYFLPTRFIERESL